MTGTDDGGAGYGELLYCEFNNPGIPDECHLSTGDSGGGMFVLEDGLWCLAGINLAVDGPFRTIPAGTPFKAALFDQRGLEYEDPPGWASVIDEGKPVPSSFYSIRISAALPWISGIAPKVASLAAEDFPAWRKLYFTPSEIADPAASGAMTDFDRDGIENLLEFALNLDPVFSETPVMKADTGLRGLPLVHLENVSGSDRLSIEFVRRTGAGAGGLTYTPEFSPDLEEWSSTGTESAVAINPRWERVKFTDSLTTGDSPQRIARLRVRLAD